MVLIPLTNNIPKANYQKRLALCFFRSTLGRFVDISMDTFNNFFLVFAMTMRRTHRRSAKCKDANNKTILCNSLIDFMFEKCLDEKIDKYSQI